MTSVLVMLVTLGVGACGDARDAWVEATTDAVVQELEPDASPKWSIHEGLAGVSLPSVMVASGSRVFVVHGKSVVEYLPGEDAWSADRFPLPGEVGSGVAAAPDDAGGIWILPGGRTRAFWRFDVATGKVESLPETPEKVGVGGSLAFDPDRQQLYALRGDIKRDFWRYDLKTRRWEVLTRVGDQTSLASIGQSTGALQYSKGFVYAWPDHHVQRYDVEAGTWHDAVHISYGQRPWWNGAAFAHDRETDRWIVLQGMASRTLSLFDPNARAFAFLKPRLPLRLTGEGSRAVILRIDGVKHLLVYAIAQGNRMLKIAIDDLDAVGPDSPASDEGSAFTTMHEGFGSSLVRRAATTPVLGVMGRAGDRWYFARLKNVRFLEPETNSWSGYPGVPVGERFEPGVCAAWDGADAIYVMTGTSTNFQRVDVPSMSAEKLPAAPVATALGGKMTFHEDRLHVLFGGESRSHAVFDPKDRSWGLGTPLPTASAPIGRSGSALFVADDLVTAISGTDVWQLDDGVWKRLMKLPFALAPDGGMTAWDQPTRRLFLIEGGGSRRLAIVDADEPSDPRHMLLPDVVSVFGDRALIDDVDGKRTLAIHRGHDTHEIFLLDVTER